MMFLTTAALAGALSIGAAAQERESRRPATDQTVTVARGARLTVNNFAGGVVVRTWDRDAVRVQATHSAGVKVGIRTAAGGVSIAASGAHGAAGSVDYEISAPAWMPLRVEGTYNAVTIEGTRAEVSAENVRGDIVIRGGTGFVTASTVEGAILVEGARGKLTLRGVNEGIKVAGASGDIVADTTNGSVELSRIESASVEASTVNGDITFDGALADRGRYRFSSHNGDLVLTLPATASATFAVRSYNGGFRSSMAVKGPPAAEVRRGRRITYTLGSGSADVEMETFGGDIRIRRAGDGQL